MTSPDERPTYYGRALTKKVKDGVHNLMLEQHIQIILDKASKHHHQQLNQIQKDFAKELRADLVTFKAKFTRLEDELKEIKARHERRKKKKHEQEMQRIKSKLEAKGIKC